MSKRRGGAGGRGAASGPAGGGGAPVAAPVGGAAWRQQQELAALTAAIRQLPAAATSLPMQLLQEVRKALTCVEHTLRGIRPLIAAGFVGTVGVAVGVGSDDGLFGKASGCIGAPAASGDGRGLEAGSAISFGATGTVCGGPSADALERVAAKRMASLLSETASAAAERCCGIDTDGHGAEPSTSGGGYGGGAATRGTARSWDGQQYEVALLHHLLALSSDFLDLCEGGGDHCGRGRVAAGWEPWWDEVATGALGRLPAGVYLRAVVHLGWEGHLLDMLSWVPQPGVKTALARRALRLCPGLAPALAAALVAVEEQEEEVGEEEAGRHHASASRPPPEQPGRAMPGSVTEDLAAWRPKGALRSLGESPEVLQELAWAAKAAAAAAEASEGCGAGAGAAEAGRRWLPCLLLLGRALVKELDGDSGSEAAVAAAGTAAAGSSPVSGQDGGAAGAAPGGDARAAGVGGVFLASACYEALQEGLCAWQGAIVAGLASGPVPMAASGSLEPSGQLVPGGEGGDRVAAALLRLLQEELLGRLDEEARRHMAAQQHHQMERPHPQPLLPYADVIRLRSRIALLGMAVGAGAVAAGAIGTEDSCRTYRTGMAVVPDRDAALRNSGTVLTADDVWRSSGKEADPRVGDPVEQQLGSRTLPTWLRAATTVPGHPARPLRQLYPPVALLLRTQPAAASSSNIRSSGTKAPAAPPSSPAPRVAALAVALLTPGLASWLQAQQDVRVRTAAGPDPYCPFRMALALLELLHGATVAEHATRGRGDEVLGRLTAGSGAQAAGEAKVALAAGRGSGGGGEAAEVTDRQRELLLLGMAAECLGCVEAAEQQMALQAVVLGSPLFASFRARLAADGELQSAAGRALVSLSNRAAAVEGSLERLALSAHQEAQRLAAAARDLLPYAVLVPHACVRRLVLDGLSHPGQLPWVLQLLRCFAISGSVTLPLPAVALPPPPPASVLLQCLQEIFDDAARLLISPADRRALLGLVDGLLREGLVATRQLLSAVVAPVLVQTGQVGSGGEALGCIPQVLSALTLTQHLLADTGASALPYASPYTLGLELAAARPARLLLAVAATLERLYELYDTRGQLEGAAVDAAAGVLERGVELYGGYVTAVVAGRATSLDERCELEVELKELYDGCSRLSRSSILVLLPLLEAAVAPPQAGGGRRDNVPPTAGAPTGAADEEEEEFDDKAEAASARARALSARLVPAALWRPRSLRAADGRTAHTAVYDTLVLAASSPAHAAAVVDALRDVVAEAEAEEEEEGADVVGDKDDSGGDSGSSMGADSSDEAWRTWGWALGPPQAVPGTAALSAGAGGQGRAGTGLAVHAASTAARGLPQLPGVRLSEGLVSALAELLRRATPNQASRVLLSILPVMVRIGGSGSNDKGKPFMWVLGVKEGGPDASGGTLLGELDEVSALQLGAEVQGQRRGDFAGAAGVAATAAFACRAAVAALRRAAGQDDARPHGPRADGAAAGVLEARVQATADRCGVHLAALTARVGQAVAAALRVATATVAQPPKPPARSSRLGFVGRDPAAGSQDDGNDGSPGGGAEWMRQEALVGVAVDVAWLLVAGLVGVAAEVAALLRPGGAAGEGATRALDVWQAVILSALQHLLSALAALTPNPTPGAATAGVPSTDAAGAGSASTAGAPRPRAVAMLRAVRRVLRALPEDAATVLWAAVEQLCEERDHELGVGEAQGPMAAAAAAAAEAAAA